MTVLMEGELDTCRGQIQPRDGFAAELLETLTRDPHHLYLLEVDPARSRSRWIVAGAVAASATGAFYVFARRGKRGSV